MISSKIIAEERIKIVDDWKNDRIHWRPIVCTPERINNADQTGLFEQKLPNSMYVDMTKKYNYAGAKRMKVTTRITRMVCTAADGSKVPLSIVGKPAKPVCFRLCARMTDLHFPTL